jgi:mannosyltransferase OCH1-like enzyme
MLPKILHYCWFGGKPLPEDYRSYVEGWQKLMPDWQIMRWDENNSPMHLPYIQKVLQERKWAHLSNFVRLFALYQYGGIYLDTDMEMLQSLEPISEYSCFLGFEMGGKPGEEILVNDAIIGATKAHPFIKKCLDFYLLEFEGSETALDSSPFLVTRLLKEAGLREYGRQEVDGVHLFPKEYFYPYHITEKFHPDCITEATYTIHHWGYSWGKKPFSYRLEALKKQVKEKVFSMLPVHLKAFFKHGKLAHDLLKTNKIKAGPFSGTEIALNENYEKNHLLAKLAGIYKEELQTLLYQLIRKKYSSVWYNGESPDYFKPGIQHLFPDADIQTLSPKNKTLNGGLSIPPNALLITNSQLASDIANDLKKFPTDSDLILEFNHHLTPEEKDKLRKESGGQYTLTFVPGKLRYNYQKNAFLDAYNIQEIEKHLKREVTDVKEWVLLERM